jgi:uncharacterized protein DUF1996
MEATSQRTWQVRLALMLIVGVASVAACVAAFMWWKAPAASAQVAASPEAVFLTRCDFSHRNTDDPIVFPGQRGAAHSHDFFGNRSTNYASTYESLRAATGTTSGTRSGTTCLNPADKSAYWIPTTNWTDNSGTRTLKASRAVFYYRDGDKADVEPPPAGLKVVPNTHVTWKCAQEGTFVPSPPSQCSSGSLVVLIRFPDCVAEDSNGQPLLDSADHRSHMAYAVRQTDGIRQCPTTHPTPVAALTMDVRFPIPTTSGTVTLSSGAASTMHADFFNAWDQQKLTALVDRCINAYPFSPANPKPAECKQTG